jgi:RimJ/RimL family protein N-acetyltransferase
MTGNITFRKAQIEDSILYFDWANDHSVRNNAISTEPIMLDTHEKWFSKRIMSETAIMYLFFENEKPVGQVRFDIEKQSAYIDYSIDRRFRGRKLGIKVLNLSIKAFIKEIELNIIPNGIIGVVNTQNTPSSKIFQQLCFERNGQETIKNQLYDIYILRIENEGNNC